jgi:AcrR family transcriptional regulator
MPVQPETHLSATLESQNGFVAPRYRSGQRSAVALLDAGRTLLSQISYEGLSVSELCKEANLTTGAFYRRFESKDAFFLALQRLALDDIAQTRDSLFLTLDANPPASLGHCAWRVVDVIRGWHLRHCGVVRASIQRRDHTPGSWRPFKENAQSFVHAIAARMARSPELLECQDAEQRLREVFQIVIGTMTNAALNDPGPLHLADEAMTDALAQVIKLYAQAVSHDAQRSSLESRV